MTILLTEQEQDVFLAVVKPLVPQLEIVERLRLRNAAVEVDVKAPVVGEVRVVLEVRTEPG